MMVKSRIKQDWSTFRTLCEEAPGIIKAASDRKGLTPKQFYDLMRSDHKQLQAFLMDSKFWD